jgi:cell division protein FtsN
MMKPITGQYECVHSSGVGLDYFTSRIDRLVVQNNGSFVLTTQNHSRVTNAAKSFMQGQQAPTTVAETRLEGTYVQQGLLVMMQFANAGSEQAHLAEDGSAMQIGPNYFTKVSDSTILPPAHRLKKDMEDINKGFKIASTIGGMAAKATKMIHGTLQTAQGTTNTTNTTNTQSTTPPTAQQPYATTAPTSTPAYVPPAPTRQPVPPVQQPATPPSAPPAQQSTAAQPGQASAIFCDQCGARIRPGKRFCNVCGAHFA